MNLYSHLREKTYHFCGTKTYDQPKFFLSAGGLHDDTFS